MRHLQDAIGSPQSKVMLSVLVLVGSAIALPAQAALPPTNLGLTSFNDGKAKPGNLSQQFVNVYEADRFMDAQGRPRPVDNELQTTVLATFIGRITEHKVLDAWYGYEALQCAFSTAANRSDARAIGTGADSVDGGVAHRSSGFSNMVIEPA